MSVEGHRHDQYSQTDHTHSTAATAAVDTNTTQIATTAFVIGQAASAVPVVNGTAAAGASTRFARGDHVHPTDTGRAASVHTHVESDVTSLVTDLGLKAPLSSPTFTGTPASVTAAADTNSTQIATTAFVVGQAASVAPSNNGTAAVGTSLRYARQDHVHNSDSTKANLAGPTFTGTVSLPSTTNYNGTQLKRMASGTSSVSFSAGSGTLSFGSTLPFTPSAVVVTPVLTTVIVIVTLGGVPTTTGVALKAWTATVANPSAVTTYASSVSSIYWIAIE